MTINLIVAHGKNREIGYNNELLWKLPEDMKRFKKITTGHTVVMGRKTYESIGKPLPNRRNVVLSSKPIDGVITASSIESFFRMAHTFPIFIIGGETLYKAFLPYADRLYITMVKAEFPQADTFFPEYEDMVLEQNWTVTELKEYKADQHNEYDTRFVVYEKMLK
jgi:dihydrofolate reductase